MKGLIIAMNFRIYANESAIQRYFMVVLKKMFTALVGVRNRCLQ